MSKNETPIEVEAFADEGTYSPEDVAVRAFGRAKAFEGGKRVRGWLRANYTRKPEDKGKSWILAPSVANAALDAMLSERVTDAPVITEADANA